jgi:hypothetical protein
MRIDRLPDATSILTEESSQELFKSLVEQGSA